MKLSIGNGATSRIKTKSKPAPFAKPKPKGCAPNSRAPSTCRTSSNQNSQSRAREKRSCVADAGTLHDCVDRIARNIYKRLDLAAGPANFYRVDFCGFAQAEMEAEVVLGEIAAAAADFCDLADAGGMDGHAGANGGAIAPCAD